MEVSRIHTDGALAPKPPRRHHRAMLRSHSCKVAVMLPFCAARSSPRRSTWGLKLNSEPPRANALEVSSMSKEHRSCGSLSVPYVHQRRFGFWSPLVFVDFAVPVPSQKKIELELEIILPPLADYLHLPQQIQR